ncbi:MAG: RNA-binding protein [Synechococcaceae cyanobacterium SM2_3_1]|nr:RNA-binding protein [Synechococcaceae cyanobacterium SM2_3_1]
MSIYVGNLISDIKEELVAEIFGKYGSIKRVEIFVEKETDRSKFFAFVDMGSDAEEITAIKALKNSNWMGQEIVIKKTLTRINGQSIFSTNWLFQHRR